MRRKKRYNRKEGFLRGEIIMPVIQARGVTHTYNGRNIILDNVDLDVERGEFLSILGASGSGKTTLLSILGGIETPTSGEVLVDGENIAAAKEKRRAVLRRTKIGFVFQFFNLAPYLNVEQNILVPVLLNGKGKRSVEKELDDLLSFVGLSDKRTAMPGKLSRARAHFPSRHHPARRADGQPGFRQFRGDNATAFADKLRVRHNSHPSHSQRT